MSVFATPALAARVRAVTKIDRAVLMTTSLKTSLWMSLATALAVSSSSVWAQSEGTKEKTTTVPTVACSKEAGGITLPPGFCATVFADGIGHARHLVVAPNGVVYVNTWSGRYYKSDKTPDGGFLVALQDKTGNGKADVVKRFGATGKGIAGGTGIAIYGNGLFIEESDRIERYDLPSKGIVPAGKPEIVVEGLPLTGDHPMHPFVIDRTGNLFVDLGSATNACQTENRMPNVVGADPCVELETRGGLWRYHADKRGQKFSPKERYATGIRNGEGLAFDASGHFYATQHGRDQLSQNWGGLYTTEQGVNLPAEELLDVHEGSDFGWPQCYFDDLQGKLVLAPEYGGDGGKKIGVCAQKSGPVAAFPAHWAPNALVIYEGDQLPAAYKGGAFIAFHGSWNRAPAPQAGYNVVFQPLKDGRVSGRYVVFADGFAGPHKEPGRALHRPSGLAVGPDGALFIGDDAGGRIWRVTYQGPDKDKAAIAAAVAPIEGTTTTSAKAEPPEGIDPDAGVSLPVPEGATAAQVARGDQIFHGEIAGGTCSGCHGSDAKGSPVGPDLTNGQWQWSDGSYEALRQVIAKGVTEPKRYQGVMPPRGGAPLADSDVAAVAAYVWALAQKPAPKATQ
ncbi:c-type cytochrome [Beijerinckia indica]|uniref:Cytochrome c class I n=1 Tax=Beijerinckia indica subsp. indica (strain ATCC 9039 / DSM 1715 / NCIMB 8712) TaxID=395963 RepID=B2IHN5_BEII9|nr:c-type cytochrome [Beijerinckia indica]ACB94556.1 cytochrome c class I [Beijerinckia indica subsp. indica ATCC 9039]